MCKIIIRNNVIYMYFLGAVLSALILYWFFSNSLIIANIAFSPSGKIYVGSPAVYTRERLVNDRNEQDFWLREELKRVNESIAQFSSVKEKIDGVDIEVVARNNSNLDKEQKSAALLPEAKGNNRADSSPSANLSYIDQFAIRSAWRDRLRQGILENLLDDRHDLTGNSVYGLKFDATVIPSWFTTGRAFIRLSIKTDQSRLIPDEVELDKNFTNLSALVQSYFNSSETEILTNEKHPNYLSYHLYNRWVDNLKWRLNSYLIGLAEGKCKCYGSVCNSIDWVALVEDTVNSVLAIDSAKVKIKPEISIISIQLPKPWANFVNIYAENAESHFDGAYASIKGAYAINEEAKNANSLKQLNCHNFPVFNVDGIQETVYLFGKQEQQENFSRIEELDDNDTIYYAGSKELVYGNYKDIVLYVKSIRKKKGIPKYCIANEEKKVCYRYVSMPSGYFNFVDEVIGSDMYAYSLFPRSDVVAQLEKYRSYFSYKLNQSHNIVSSGLSGNSGRYWEEAGLAQTLVGFTDSRSDALAKSQNDKSIQLGWVNNITVPGKAVQSSQFALVSVPAWTSQLKIEVKTGWLDGDSREIINQNPYDITVPIPPDYEAFDAFVGGRDGVRRPKINKGLMEAVNLTACQSGSVVIPGFRLWRSAMVTIGSQRADKITVLPNMGGLIADFKEVQNIDDGTLVSLKVWTSEGVDSVRNVTIVNHDTKGCSDRNIPTGGVQ